MRDLLRLLYFMEMFLNTLSSEAGDLGLKFTVALMDPILFERQLNYAPLQDERASGLRIRPQTPGPTAPYRLSPIEHVSRESKKKRNRSNHQNQLVVIDNPILKQPEPFGRLSPIEPKKKNVIRPRQSSWGSSNPPSPIPIQDFYDELEAAISASNEDAVSYLTSRSEMKFLGHEDLLELLKTAYSRNKKPKASREVFWILFETIVDKIVPEIHPHHFERFIVLATRQSAPRKLFSMACKHVNLLSTRSLNNLVQEIEGKYIWERLDRIGFGDVKKFNFMIMEIADNLENSQDLVKLDHVQDVLSMKKDDSIGGSFDTTLPKIQFIYITTYLLSALKLIDPMIEDKEMEDALNNLIKIGRRDLKLDTEDVLKFMEPVWRVFRPHISTEQIEPIGRFLDTLRTSLMAQDDLPYIPERMAGVEDLFMYVNNNLISLMQARLKYNRSSKLTKGQLLALLNTADFSSDNDPSMILLILGSVTIDPRSISEQDFSSLTTTARIALKVFFTIPKRFDGPICTRTESLKQIEPVEWNIPDDLFIQDEISGNIYALSDMLMNIPRLFLYRVFGLPLINFAEVSQGMNELPEMKELIQIANFFLERWCSSSLDGPYPRVKVVISE